jgi:hypothetical protein
VHQGTECVGWISIETWRLTQFPERVPEHIAPTSLRPEDQGHEGLIVLIEEPQLFLGMQNK